jgi:alpha-1,2-mannosyltransferase
LSTRRQWVAVGLTAIAIGVFLATVPTFRHFFDLDVYRGAVRYWLIDGGDLYDYVHDPLQPYGFTYPPFAALVFSPLALTSWPVAVIAGLLLNVTAVVLLLRWFLLPVLTRNGWPVWIPAAFGFLAIVLFEPARDTISFGQVNLMLLVLVCIDMRALLAGRRWAGVCIGIATAIKLTPAVFIGYLLVTRRFRAAAVAACTTAAATGLAVLVAPDASRRFWTEALFDTSRVGKLAYVSNQSLRGVVARLSLPSLWWVVAVAVVLVVWFLLVRRLPLVDGFARTGVLACLISPVTWVHHLVWLLPALFLLLADALDRRDRRRLIWLGAVYVIMCSSIVWLWFSGGTGVVAAIGSNTYVWISLGLLVASPVVVHRPEMAEAGSL